jgi:hypothetical protein
VQVSFKPNNAPGATAIPVPPAGLNAFLLPPYLGLCRFDVTVPQLPAGEYVLQIAIAGTSSGQTLLTVAGQ